MALSHRHAPAQRRASGGSAHSARPTHAASAAAATTRTAASGEPPAWRRLVPAADTVWALVALTAALAVFADFAATF